MTMNELVQGVVVRVLIVVPIVITAVAVMVTDADIIHVNGIPIPFLSIVGLLGILYFIANDLGLDHPAILWIALVFLFAIALSRSDELRVPGTDTSIRLTAMIGILSLQHPFSLWVLRQYQRIASRTREEIELEVDAVTKAEMKRIDELERKGGNATYQND